MNDTCMGNHEWLNDWFIWLQRRLVWWDFLMIFYATMEGWQGPMTRCTTPPFDLNIWSETTTNRFIRTCISVYIVYIYICACVSAFCYISFAPICYKSPAFYWIQLMQVYHAHVDHKDVSLPHPKGNKTSSPTIKNTHKRSIWVDL